MSNKAKHTAGPWRVGDGEYIWCAKGFGVARCYGPISREEMQSNARLIAAGPEMLEALRDIEDEIGKAVADVHSGFRDEPDAVLEDWRARAFAAIAKAEGREGVWAASG